MTYGRLNDPSIPAIGMVNIPALHAHITGSTNITKAKKATQPCEALVSNHKFTVYGAVEIQGTITASRACQPTHGPYNNVLSSEDEYQQADDEQRVQGYINHFQDDGQPRMPRHRPCCD